MKKIFGIIIVALLITISATSFGTFIDINNSDEPYLELNYKRGQETDNYKATLVIEPGIITKYDMHILEANVNETLTKPYSSHTFKNNIQPPKTFTDLHIKYREQLDTNEKYIVKGKKGAVPTSGSLSDDNTTLNIYGSFPPDSEVSVLVFPGSAKIEYYWWTWNNDLSKTKNIPVTYLSDFFPGASGHIPWYCEYIIENDNFADVWVYYVNDSNIDEEEVIVYKTLTTYGCILGFEGYLEDFDKSGFLEALVEITLDNQLGYEYVDLVLVIDPDNENPSLEISKPDNGIYINNNKILPFFLPLIIIGDMNIVVEASDGVSGMDCVEFYINDELMYIDYEIPYNYLWSVAVTLKFFSIEVKAYDVAGNSVSDKILLFKIF